MTASTVPLRADLYLRVSTARQAEHEFNKRSKTEELKPVSEIVTVPVPPPLSTKIRLRWFRSCSRLLIPRSCPPASSAAQPC
jgi:hypothetical protein